MKAKRVIKHLKEDIKMFKKEAGEDRDLMKDLEKHHNKKGKSMKCKHCGHKMHKEIKSGKKELKVKKVMHEYKEGKLHSGSKRGPVVTNPKQAIAISLSEARKAVRKKK